MIFNKIFRVVVALLMVFCLVVNISPINAEAAAVSSAVAVSGAFVVAGILIGLGLLPGEVSDDFNRLVDDTVDYLSSVGAVAVDGTMLLWKTVGIEGNRLYVDKNIVNDVRSFLISTAQFTIKHIYLGNDVISKNHANLNDTIRQRLREAQSYKYILVIDNHSNVYGVDIVVSDSPLLMTYYGNNDFYKQFYAADGSQIMLSCNGAAWSPTYDVYTENNPEAYTPTYHNYVGPGVATVESSLQLNYGNVNFSSTDLNAAYDSWAAGSVPIYVDPDGGLSDESQSDDNQPIPYWPIGVGKTYDETISSSQSQVQTGESTYEDTSTDSGTDVGGATSSISQSWLGSKLDSFILSISGFFSDIKSTVQAIPDAFSTWFQDVISSVQAIPGAFSTWFQDVISLLQSIPGTILSGIQAIFVPSADFLTAKVEALRARFDFINVFMDFIDSFKGELSGATPPVIYVHLENAEGSYNYGGTVKFLDMSWYSRYKSTGDAIISGFLWALFGWRMYLKLPGIINGVSGGVGSMSSRFRKDGE